MTGAMGSHQSSRSLSTTWLTPLSIIADLGPFDLDPCGARNWPTADTVWSDQPDSLGAMEDGLSLGWRGRVWLNPPYDRVWEWLDRLAGHGRGTALVFARTETRGFVEQVWGRATALRFLHGRLHFHRPDGTRAPRNAGAPSVLVGYGPEDAARLASSTLAGTFVRLRECAA